MPGTLKTSGGVLCHTNANVQPSLLMKLTRLNWETVPHRSASTGEGNGSPRSRITKYGDRIKFSRRVQVKETKRKELSPPGVSQISGERYLSQILMTEILSTTHVEIRRCRRKTHEMRSPVVRHQKVGLKLLMWTTGTEGGQSPKGQVGGCEEVATSKTAAWRCPPSSALRGPPPCLGARRRPG